MTNKYQKVLFFGMAVLMIFMPLARGTVKVWSVAPFLLISYLLIFIWLWRVNNAKTGTVPLGMQGFSLAGTVPVFLFGLLAVVSFVFSIYKHDSFFALLRLFAYIGIFYMLIKNFEGHMFRRLLGLVILIGTVLSLYGILQYLDFFKHSWWIPQEFLAATYVNHNHFAGYLELTIPLTLGMLFSHSSEFRFKKLILGIALYIQASAFILTQSRGGWLSLSTALLAMGIVLIKNRALKIRHFIIFVILLALAFSLIYWNDREVSERTKSLSAPISEPQNLEASLSERLKIWQGAFGMVKDRPLIGVGIGDFDSGFYRFRPEDYTMRAVYAHNDYLHMAAEMGVFAPILMLLIFAAIILRGIKLGSHPLVLGSAMGILSLALHGLVDFNFHIPANMLLFTVCAAYVMRPRRRDK